MEEVEDFLQDNLSEENIKIWLEGTFVRAYSVFFKIISDFECSAKNIEKFVRNYNHYMDHRDLNSRIFCLFYLIDDDQKETGSYIIVGEDEYGSIVGKNKNFKPSNKVILDNEIMNDYFIRTGWARKGADPPDINHHIIQIYSNKEIEQLLKSAIRMMFFDGFKYYIMDYESQDYTYLMLNYVKSLEKYLYYKMNQLDLLNHDEKEHITFYGLVEKVKDYLNHYKDFIPKVLLDCYCELLDDFRKENRNGYFHRDILSKKDAYTTIDLAIILMLLTTILVDTQVYYKRIQDYNYKFILKNRVGYYDEEKKGFYLEALLQNKTNLNIKELSITLIVYTDVQSCSTEVRCHDILPNEEIKIQTLDQNISFNNKYSNIGYEISDIQIIDL